MVAMGIAHLVAAWLVWIARQRIGGVTGDVIGLVIEVSEVIILLTFVLLPTTT